MLDIRQQLAQTTLVTNIEDIPEIVLPNEGTKEAAILGMTWRRPVLQETLATVSVQAAAFVRSLRRKGFVFAQEKSNFTFRQQDNTFRCILGWDKDNVFDASIASKLSLKYKREILKSGCAFTGSFSNLEIDHKVPIGRHLANKTIPPELNNSLYESGEFKNHFQVLTKSVNALKRERCNKCIRTNQISIPPVITKLYKVFYDGTCEGCFWHTMEG